MAQLFRNDTTHTSASAHHHQNVVVMRHGDRIDNFEPRWIKNSPRPWDPPLVEEGKVRAFCTSAKLRSDLGFPVHRVFVSPFVRCVEVVTALASLEMPSLAKYDSRQALPLTPPSSRFAARVVDPTKGNHTSKRVSIEYGLCEMLNKEAIRGDVAPKDGNWGFNMPELEAKFSEGTVDRTSTFKVNSCVGRPLNSSWFKNSVGYNRLILSSLPV
ncbi:hypothetical protein OROMI_004215 [Orobanche minor]